MMTLRTLFMLVLLSVSFSSFSQSEIKYPATLKSTVIVDYFNAGMGVPDRQLYFVDYLRDKIIEGLRYSKRVKIYDVDDNMELRAYDNRNMNSVEKMRNRYAIMQSLDVDYVIECDVKQITATPSTSSAGKWVGMTSYTIRLVDPNTGNVVTKLKYETIDSQYTSETPEKAITGSLNYIIARMNVFILDNFRIEGQMLDVVSMKKDDEVKEVNLNVGPDNAAAKGTKFEVHKVANGIVGAKIGEVKISEITGPQSSLAKVTKGGKEIKNAIDAGEVLMILSDKSSFWDHF